MLGFVIQRLLQAFVVMLVDLGAGVRRRLRDRQPDRCADLARRRPAASASWRSEHYGLDLPLWQQYLALSRPARRGRFRPLVRLQHAGAGADPVAPAGDAGAHAGGRDRRDADRHAARHVCGLPARQRCSSKLIMALSILGFSVPTFWVGLVLILTFAVTLGWLPAGGRGETVDAVRRRMELPHARTA